jgi:uncharacterized membrane protein
VGKLSSRLAPRPLETAMSLYKIVLSLHGLLGVLALVTFWLAGLTRKGSPVHRAAGKVYLAAMVVLLGSAVPLAIRIGVQKHWVAGVFLGYLLVITTTSVWSSWRAIRDKRDWARYTGRVYRALAGLNLASGAVILALGLFYTTQMKWIFVGFSLVGLLGGRSMLRFAGVRPTEPKWWLKEHFGAMIGNGVATHIAFLSIGLPKVLPMLAGPVLQNVAWLGPLSLAVAARMLLNRKYMKPRGVAKSNPPMGVAA